MSLGIGIITYNRRAALQRCYEFIQQHTPTPFYLMVADDGSTDSTEEWCCSTGIPVVTGENRGCAWNKNRALYHLLNATDCDPILLIEDDVLPHACGWESDWIEAAARWGHINYSHPYWRDEMKIGAGTPQNPHLTDRITGQCTASTRAALGVLGYLDTRFHGWGYEHVDWTFRWARHEGYEANKFPCIADHLSLQEVGSFADLKQAAINKSLVEVLEHDPLYRPPFRTLDEGVALMREQQADGSWI